MEFMEDFIKEISEASGITYFVGSNNIVASGTMSVKFIGESNDSINIYGERGATIEIGYDPVFATKDDEGWLFVYSDETSINISIES